MKKLIINKISVFIFFLILILIFLPDNSRGQWIKTNGPNGGWCRSIHFHNGYLFALATGQGIYRSSDSGNNWMKVYNCSTYSFEMGITSLGSYIFAAIGNSGVIRSSNNGNTWETVNNGFPYQGYSICTIGSVNQYIICASYAKTFRSSDYGNTWDSCTNGLSTPFYTYSLNTIGSNIYAGTGKGAFVSTNNGSSWNSINNDIPTLTTIKIGTDGLSLYALTSVGVYKSSNNGQNWNVINNGLSVNWYYDIYYDGSYLYVTNLDSTFRSSNGGSYWEVCNTGLVSNAVHNFCSINGKIFCATSGGAGIQYTTNHGTQWLIANSGFHCFYSEYITAKDNLIYTCAFMQGLAVSSNNGASWQTVSNNYIDRYTKCVSANNTCIFLSTSLFGMQKSTDNGINWIQCNNGLPSYQTWNIVAFDDVVFISNYDSTYRTTNSGLSWSLVPIGYYSIYMGNITRIGNVFLAGNPGMEYGGLIRSTNYGVNWTGYYNYYPSGLIAKDSIFYFYYNDSMFKSTNLGLNWISFGTDIPYAPYSMHVIGNKLTALTYNSGVYLSTNNGINWIARNQGFEQNMNYYSIIQKDENVFLGTNKGVWKRQVSDLVNINKISSKIPSSFSLFQNYPNPFNPTTNIKYQILNNSNVTLKIYDILGKEIATLINNEKHTAGTYEVNWDASTYPSGVYFYKLTAGDFTSVKRMMLVK